ncbi:MAG TPA: sulfatase [Sphingobacteriaceae bacterium]|nr:sulfatase [Sphingobacteriaceae bacterium]
MNKLQSFFFMILFPVLACNTHRKAEERGINKHTNPNIIIILADQWRAQATGYNGNKDVITPNLDKLAKESLVFNTCVAVMPVCTPYRASLLTGQYPLTHGLFYNDKPLPNKAITIAEIYKDNGYKTGYIGKWHLNGHKEGEDTYNQRKLPVTKDRRQGFDYWKVAEVTHDYNNSFYFDENDNKQVWKGYDSFPQTDSAISYIRKNKNNPFLLVLSWGPPHDPYFSAPAEYRKLYDPAKINLRPNVPSDSRDTAKIVLANYYAHCTSLDKALGNLLNALEKEGIADNTLLVFTSDHGDMLYTKGELKKQRPWDESILVPLLIRYPEVLGRKQKHINTPVNTPDILPTLLGLSHISAPASIEGKDFSKALKSGKEPTNEAALIMMPVPFHEWNFSKGGKEYRAIRTKRYTYARDLYGAWLLYDNVKDPYQLNNLVNNKSNVRLQKEMETLLRQKLKDTNDTFLPADEYMKQWKYRYDYDDSIRPATYYTDLKFKRNKN